MMRSRIRAALLAAVGSLAGPTLASAEDPAPVPRPVAAQPACPASAPCAVATPGGSALDFLLRVHAGTPVAAPPGCCALSPAAQPQPCPSCPTAAPAAPVVYRLRNAAAADVAQAVNCFFGRESCGVRVVAEPVSNTLMVSAEPAQVQRVVKILDAIDREPPSVRVELTIVQAPADFAEKVGLRRVGEYGGPACELTDRERQMLHAMLRQGQQDGTVKFLSAPVMVVFDNQTGHAHVGGQYPCPTPAADGKPARVEMMPVGLQARVTPRVLPDGKVLVRVETTHTTACSGVTLANGVTTPAFNVEGTSVTACLKDGATAVFTGGWQAREVRHECGPPVVSTIPYVNRMFKNVGYATERTELLVLVTAHLVRPTATPTPVAPPVAVTRPAPVPVPARPAPTPPFPVAGTVALPCPAPAAVPVPATAARPYIIVPAPEPRSSSPACCGAGCGSCDKAKAAELVKAYHKACAAGDRDAATRCAVQALALDPTCFSPSK